MKRSFVLVALFALLCSLVTSFSLRGTAVAAGSRCSAANAGDLDAQTREYSKHTPSEKERAQRFADLDQIVQDAGMEEGVLTAACDKEPDRIKIDSQLRATAAWALVQQADITQAQLALSCPAAKDVSAQHLLAAAWYELAKGTPEGATQPPKPIAAIIPMVQSRAAALKLTLPATVDTSSYWRDQLGDQAKTALAACGK